MHTNICYLEIVTDIKPLFLANYFLIFLFYSNKAKRHSKKILINLDILNKPTFSIVTSYLSEICIHGQRYYKSKKISKVSNRLFIHIKYEIKY